MGGGFRFGGGEGEERRGERERGEACEVRLPPNLSRLLSPG